MKLFAGRAYNWSVRSLMVAGAILAVGILSAGRASAEPVSVDVGNATIVNVRVTGGIATIRTWSRNQVQVEAQRPVDVRHFTADQIRGKIPPQISNLAQTARTGRGDMTIPNEIWVLPPIPGDHDAVIVRGSGDAVITIPANTALVVAQIVTRGVVTLQNYHNGVFYAKVRAGGIELRDVSGTGYAETLRGPIAAYDSSFDRLRARSAVGSLFFENCAARQIEATSELGNVVYDNGSFTPGLARFESRFGDVALGVTSGAEVSAHSGDSIVTDSNVRNSVTNRGANDARATFDGGGAAVTASSAQGRVLLYEGSLRDHPHVAANSNNIRRVFERHAPIPRPRPPR